MAHCAFIRVCEGFCSPGLGASCFQAAGKVQGSQKGLYSSQSLLPFLLLAGRLKVSFSPPGAGNRLLFLCWGGEPADTSGFQRLGRLQHCFLRHARLGLPGPAKWKGGHVLLAHLPVELTHQGVSEQGGG